MVTTARMSGRGAMGGACGSFSCRLRANLRKSATIGGAIMRANAAGATATDDFAKPRRSSRGGGAGGGPNPNLAAVMVTAGYGVAAAPAGGLSGLSGYYQGWRNPDNRTSTYSP